LRRFQANPDSPVYRGLMAITRKILGVANELRDALQPLIPDVERAWVYGALAKETDTASIDVDVMLIGGGLSIGRALAHLLPFEERLGRKINPPPS